MCPELLWAIVIGLIIYALYKLTVNNDYFAKQNLPYEKPMLFFGNSFETFGKITITKFAQKLYNSFPNEKMYGRFDFRRPVVIIRDADLLKQLAVKGFDHFEDHQSYVDPSTDELFGSSLIQMKGQRWRDMRATLSPAFTGSKMRQMSDLVMECAEGIAKYFQEQSAEGKQIDLEMRDFSSRYTTDVVATCAFGIRVNSFENPNNEFYLAGSEFSSLSLSTVLKCFFLRAMPWIAKKLDIQLIRDSVRTYFSKIIIKTMEERKKQAIVRNDMIDILMQIRQGELSAETAAEKVHDVGFAIVHDSDIEWNVSTQQWADNELVAQAFLVFIAGFDTTSTTLTFLSYELCVNPDIQQKLHNEIVETESMLAGKRISYETLQKMKYMDQVVCECLRKWPPILFVDRLCVRDYVCEMDDGKVFRFEKGVLFLAQVYGFHHDPRYFPEPERFDPERFSDENKDKIVPGTYLPFGIGPRNCIGSRFALLELKAILYHILLHFTLVPNAKSQIPLQLKKSSFALQSEKGVHVTLSRRK